MANKDLHQAYVRLRSQPSGDWLVHQDLRPRLVADAQAQNTNLSEVAIQILARRYGVPVPPTGRSSNPSPDGEALVLWLPPRLLDALTDAAKARGRGPGWSYVDEIRAALCAHYGFRLPPKPKRKRGPAATPA